MFIKKLHIGRWLCSIKKSYLICGMLVIITPIPDMNVTSNASSFLQKPTPSLVGNDHTFSGSLLRLNDGKLIHIFRLDTGINSNHVGNQAAIAKRISNNNGKTWSKPQIIYNDEYDDRVSSANLLDNGSIIVFFFRYRTFEQWSGYTVDNNYIISKNNGKTWSKRFVIDSATTSTCFMSIFKIKGIKGYFVPTYGNNYIDIRYSRNGTKWNTVYCKWDYREDCSLDVSEPCFVSCGKGKIIGLFRVENKPIHQVVSLDYGKTWTKPKPTSLANGFFCPYPYMFYDNKLKKLFTIVTDRRGGSYSEKNKESGLWVYVDNADKVMNNPKSYSLSRFVNRPDPNIFRFLGYPASVKVSKSTYLIVFSDSYKRNENQLENADYYQCYFTLFPNKRYKKTS